MSCHFRLHQLGVIAPILRLNQDTVHSLDHLLRSTAFYPPFSDQKDLGAVPPVRRAPRSPTSASHASPYRSKRKDTTLLAKEEDALLSPLQRPAVPHTRSLLPKGNNALTSPSASAMEKVETDALAAAVSTRAPSQPVQRAASIVAADGEMSSFIRAVLRSFQGRSRSIPGQAETHSDADVYSKPGRDNVYAADECPHDVEKAIATLRCAVIGAEAARDNALAAAAEEHARAEAIQAALIRSVAAAKQWQVRALAASAQQTAASTSRTDRPRVPPGNDGAAGTSYASRKAAGRTYARANASTRGAASSLYGSSASARRSGDDGDLEDVLAIAELDFALAQERAASAGLRSALVEKSEEVAVTLSQLSMWSRAIRASEASLLQRIATVSDLVGDVVRSVLSGAPFGDRICSGAGGEALLQLSHGVGDLISAYISGDAPRPHTDRAGIAEDTTTSSRIAEQAMLISILEETLRRVRDVVGGDVVESAGKAAAEFILAQPNRVS